jgi:tripartite-type tricarboxylate transporter receptor subunit TctC
MKKSFDIGRRTGGALFAAALLLPATAALGAADFAGKRVTIVVPFAEGGGSDAWTRMMAPYLEKTLPGNPKVLILNKPGAGGISGANYYHDRAPKDGSMILTLSISTAMNYALGDPRIKFKIEEYHPVLSSPRSSVQYIRKDLGLADIKDLKGKIQKIKSFPPDKLTFGGRTPTSSDLVHRVGLSLLGIETNNVWGLGGTGPMAMGFERGEFMLSTDNSLAFMSQRKHMIDSGLAQPLFTLGNYDSNGKYGRDPALPDVPSYVEAYEAIHGKKPSGAGFEAWEALASMNVAMNKTLLLHPDTPKEAVEAWRTAMREMLKDEDFMKIAAPELGPYPQIVGEPIKPIMTKALTLQPEVRAWLAKFVKVRYDIDLAPQ